MAFLQDFLGLTIKNARGEPISFNDDSAALNAASVYFKAAAIDTAVSYISGALSKCEIKTFQNQEETRGELYHLFNFQPNPNQNAVQFMNDLITRLLLNGEALIVPLRNHLYVAQSFGVENHPLLRNAFRSVVIEEQSLKRSFLSDKVCYLKYGNNRVKDLINGIWDEYGDMMANAFNGFKQHAGNKWKLAFDAPLMGSRSQMKADDQERQDPSGPLKRFMGDANSVYIQQQGYDLTQFDPIDGVDAPEIVTIRKEQFEIVASIFKIPPTMIFGNMTNLAEITNSFLTYAVDPIADQISKEFTAKFFTPEEIARGSRVSVDTTRIQHIDIFNIAPAISALIGSGFSLDEIRDATGWPQIGSEESQEHLITRNYGPLEEVLATVAQGGGSQQWTQDTTSGDTTN